jgi:hypothetical protein
VHASLASVQVVLLLVLFLGPVWFWADKLDLMGSSCSIPVCSMSVHTGVRSVVASRSSEASWLSL